MAYEHTLITGVEAVTREAKGAGTSDEKPATAWLTIHSINEEKVKRRMVCFLNKRKNPDGQEEFVLSSPLHLIRAAILPDMIPTFTEYAKAIASKDKTAFLDQEYKIFARTSKAAGYLNDAIAKMRAGQAKDAKVVADNLAAKLSAELSGHVVRVNWVETEDGKNFNPDPKPSVVKRSSLDKQGTFANTEIATLLRSYKPQRSLDDILEESAEDYANDADEDVEVAAKPTAAPAPATAAAAKTTDIPF